MTTKDPSWCYTCNKVVDRTDCEVGEIGGLEHKECKHQVMHYHGQDIEEKLNPQYDEVKNPPKHKCSFVPFVLEDWKSRVRLSMRLGDPDPKIHIITTPFVRCNRCKTCGTIAFDNDSNDDTEQSRAAYMGIMSRDAIRFRRKVAGISRSMLASRAGVAEEIIKKIEKGLRGNTVDINERLDFALTLIEAALKAVPYFDREWIREKDYDKNREGFKKAIEREQEAARIALNEREVLSSTKSEAAQ